MKKTDRNRQKRLQQKRERANQKRKTRTYNPAKHYARYLHQDAQHPDNQVIEL